MRASRKKFCHYLVGAREESGKSLDEIAGITRIPIRSLQRLEAGEFEKLPADTFVRGFLRSYARCVGLDVDETIRRYAACGLTPAPVASPMAEELVGSLATLESSTPSYHTRRGATPSSDEAHAEPEPAGEPGTEGAAAEGEPDEGTATASAGQAGAGDAAAEGEPDEGTATASAGDRASQVEEPAPTDAAQAEAPAGAEEDAPALASSAADSDRAQAAAEDAGKSRAPRRRKRKRRKRRRQAKRTAAKRARAGQAESGSAAGSVDRAERHPAGNAAGTPGQQELEKAADSPGRDTGVQAEAAEATAEPEASPPAADSQQAATGDGPPVDEAAAGEQADGRDGGADAPAGEASAAEQRQDAGDAPDPEAPPKAKPAPVLVIDDERPEEAERIQEDRQNREREDATWRNFLPPALLDSEEGSRRGALTLAVIILVIVATLTMSYLMRRPNDAGDGVTQGIWAPDDPAVSEHGSHADARAAA